MYTITQMRFKMIVFSPVRPPIIAQCAEGTPSFSKKLLLNRCTLPLNGDQNSFFNACSYHMRGVDYKVQSKN